MYHDTGHDEGMDAFIPNGNGAIEPEYIVPSNISPEVIYVFGRNAGVKSLLDELEPGIDIVGRKSSNAFVCTRKGLDALIGFKSITRETFELVAKAGICVKLIEDDTYAGYKIGVVVPAYNEERLIGSTLKSIPAYIDRIYVIDDGSTDRTSEIIEASDDPRVLHIRHAQNKGVGAAIVSGYKRAISDEMDIVVVMAGDGQMDPVQLPALLAPLIEGKADYTKGNRLQTKEHRKGMRPWRQFGNFILSLLNKISSGYWQVSDPQNGYTAITRKALVAMEPDTIYTYYGYCNDMLVKLNAQGMKVKDVSMPSRYGSERSSIKYVPYIIKVSYLLLRDFLWRLKTKYILKDFHPLVLFYAAGAVMAPLSLPLFAVSAFGLLDAAIPVIILIAGFQSLVMAMAMDRNADRGKDA